MSDSLVARADRTVDALTLFATNSDRRGFEPQPFIQLPTAYHPRGATVRCTHVEIDQVAETCRVMGHSPLWCWGFEQGVNEYGVAISYQATWSREALEETPGLIGMDLVRLGLERGGDAREALEVIACLIETHGQGGPVFDPEDDAGSQNGFMIADGRSAWVLETTARGWAARSVEAASLSSALTLGADWQIGSRELERRALQHGFWTRGGRLDFKAAYAPPEWPAYLTEQRERAASRLLTGPQLSIEDVKEWLRDHGASDDPPAEGLAREDPDKYSVCMHAEPIAATTASLAVRLPKAPQDRPWAAWVSFAAPCVGIFLPVYLEGTLPPPLAWAETEPAEGSPSSLWWAMRRLQEKAAVDYRRTLPRVRQAWREVEAAIERDRVRAEEAALERYRDDDDAGAARILSDFMQESCERTLDAARRITAGL